MLRCISAILISYIAVYITKYPIIEHAGFFTKIFGFLFTIAVSFYAFKIGEKIRDFAMPDFIITDGGATSAIKAKLFWKIGIQIIASAVGALLATLLFFKIFGPSERDIAAEEAARIQAANAPIMAEMEKKRAAYEEITPLYEAYHNAVSDCEKNIDRSSSDEEPFAKCAAVKNAVEELRKKGICPTDPDTIYKIETAGWEDCPKDH